MDIRQAVVLARDDFPSYAELFLKIRPKVGGLVPMKFNKAQLYLHENAEKMKAEKGYVRIIFLKARQLGGSSVIAARMLRNTMYTKGVKTAIQLHDRDSTNAMFDMVKRYYNNLPSLIKPVGGRNNDKKFTFPEVDSEFIVSTAGAKTTGHGQTIHNAFFSEVSRWPNQSEHASGILQTVSLSKGTEVWIESTSNGVGDWFHSTWVEAIEGRNEFLPLFFGWLDHEDYRAVGEEWDDFWDDEEKFLHENLNASFEQLQWRRSKIAELGGGDVGKSLFKRQYPATPEEAFLTSSDSYLEPLAVREAMTTEPFDAFGAVVIGVDPAYMGKDSTAIAVRKGRCVLEIIKLERADAAQTVGRLLQLHRKYGAKRIFCDIGYGISVYDHGREAGLPIEAVNFGSGPVYTNEVKNRRAELYYNFARWVKETPCSIVAVPGLEEELLATGYTHDAKGKLLMQPKDEIRKKIKRSPDMADAIALTFSSPVYDDDALVVGAMSTGSFELADY